MGKSIATRLIALLTLSAALIIGTGMLLDYRVSREEILQRLSEQAVVETEVVVRDMENWLNGIEATTRLMARILEQREYSRNGLKDMLRDVVANNDEIFGAAIALNPDLASGGRPFAPYYYSRDGQVHFTDLANRQARYTEQPWFTVPLERGEALWSEPYFDTGGGEVNMTTFSVPVYRVDSEGRRQIYGVVTADVTLDALHAVLQQLHLGASSYGLLFSREGMVMSTGSGRSIMQHYTDLHYKGLDLDSWRRIFQRALQGQTSTMDFPCPESEDRCTIRLGQLQTTGWPIGVSFRQQEVLSPLHTYTLKTLAISAVTLLLLALVVYLLTSRLTRPLQELTRATEQIARGNLDTPLPKAQGEDEVARLVESFSTMNRSLKGYIDDLAAATASRSRIEGELAAAREIQMSMLPGDGDILLTEPGFELWARVTPARTVGGDLYTLFRQGEQFYFAVGDVSDKGVPAALFMARAISLIQQLSLTMSSPERTMAELNNALERNNQNCMFVTLFLGVLNLRDGALRFASAGHTAPSLLRDGSVQVVAQDTGPALGLAADQDYPGNTLQLLPGDRLAVYTDGIDEAFSPEEEMFGTARFNAELLAQAQSPVAQAGAAVFDAVAEHAGTRAQSDDITLLLVQYAGGDEPMSSESFHLGSALTTRVQQWLQDVMRGWDLPSTLITELCLVAEEIASNTQKYAGLSAEDRLELMLILRDNALVLKARDRGVAFNPLSEGKRAPLGADIDAAEIGGLGVHLIVQLTDRQRYRRDGEYNILRVERDLPDQSGQQP
ncbi:SpoIIE family protein phosphatase [Pseudohalioglobus sediminis]|nr:SpoIIE family protein phosphatase [Pseudohalioglobus sediminis]